MIIRSIIGLVGVDYSIDSVEDISVDNNNRTIRFLYNNTNEKIVKCNINDIGLDKIFIFKYGELH